MSERIRLCAVKPRIVHRDFAHCAQAYCTHCESEYYVLGRDRAQVDNEAIERTFNNARCFHCQIKLDFAASLNALPVDDTEVDWIHDEHGRSCISKPRTGR